MRFALEWGIGAALAALLMNYMQAHQDSQRDPAEFTKWAFSQHTISQPYHGGYGGYRSNDD